MREGEAGLLREKRRRPGLPPLLPALVDRVVQLTLAEPPGEATHWTGRAMAAATGVSLRSVQRIWAVQRLEPTGCAASSYRRTRPSPLSSGMQSVSTSTRRLTP